MQFPIKPLYKRVRKDGTTNISIQYCYDSESRTLLDTGIAIPAKYWDKKNCCISRGIPSIYGNRDDLNLEISRLIRIVENLLAIAKRKKIAYPLTFIKETFKPNLDEKSLKEKEAIAESQNPHLNLDIFFQIDDYINSKKHKVSKDMPRIYRNMKDHLKAFETFRKKPVIFNCLNHDFYEEFVEFLSFDYVQKHRREPVIGLKINTIGKTIKQFRTFLRNRIRKRIIPQVDLEGWNILEEEVDAIYCNWNEINRIYNIDLQQYPHLGEGFSPNIFSCINEQTVPKSTAAVSNPYALTPEEIMELADYNIQLWMDLKANLRRHELDSAKIFNQDALR